MMIFLESFLRDCEKFLRPKKRRKNRVSDEVLTLEEVIFPLYHQRFSEESGLFSVHTDKYEETQTG